MATNEEAYDNYRRWKGWENRSFGQFSRAEAAYFADEMKAAGLCGETPLRILELGFGDGRFARWATAQGHSYTGVEIIPELRQSAASSGITAIDPAEIGARIPPASLDLVTAFDVLEHIELAGILDQLRLFRELLKPGGTVLARVPSGDSPFGRATQYGDITHRVVLGSSAVRQIAELSGYTVVRIGAPVLPLRGVSPAVVTRRLAIKLLRSAAEKLIRLSFHSNSPTVINASMVFVLRRPLTRDATSPSSTACSPHQA